MPLRKLIPGFLLRFAFIYGLLILPWSGWNELYGQYFRTLGQMAYSREGENRIVYFERHDLQHGFSTLNTRMTMGNTGTVLPAVTEEDCFTDTNVDVYWQNEAKWTDWFRSTLTMRGDLGYFDVTSLVTPQNSGTAGTILPNPKLSLVFGPWDKTEFYVQGGFDYHSNDGRGATQTIEPISADSRWSWRSHSISTFTFWT